jgi:hypothetical protein
MDVFPFRLLLIFTAGLGFRSWIGADGSPAPFSFCQSVLLATRALSQARSPVVAAVVHSLGDLLVSAVATDKFLITGLVLKQGSKFF